MASSILDKLRKNSTIKASETVDKSELFEDKDTIRTVIPGINVALGGAFDGGFVPGTTVWAGPPKHFKSLFSLIMAKSYLDKYPDAAILFYDNEFGTPRPYFDSLGIDQSRVLHSPFLTLEDLRHDVIVQLEGVERGDHFIIVVDSIGNAASKKELEDALSGSDKADMTRSKVIKSFFRLATPALNIKNIPMNVVNHTYQTQEMYSQTVVSGGTGIYYGANNIFVVGRSQNKEEDEVVGFDFKLRVEKSRFVKEKSVIPITVNYQKGISKWSGLFDLAIESGIISSPKKGWYALDTDPEKLFRSSATESSAFWLPLLTDKEQRFGNWVKETYQLGNISLIQQDEE